MKINLVLLLITSFLFAENSPSFKTQLMYDGFSQPLLVRFHPETNAMFVVEQTGKIKLIEKNSSNLNMQDLGLFWQLTLRTIEDLKVVSNEEIALEMFLMQLMHLRGLENHSFEKTLENIGV